MILKEKGMLNVLIVAKIILHMLHFTLIVVGSKDHEMMIDPINQGVIEGEINFARLVLVYILET